MSAVFADEAALKAAIGTSIGTSSWIEVDQERIDRFAAATNDFQWIHTDPERAANSPFGSTIAHGFLTLALIAPVIQELLRIEGIGMGVNYGLNRVRFPAPVLSGSRIRGHVELTGVEDFAGGLQVVVTITFEREGSPKPVCIAELLLRYYAKQT